MSDYKRYVNDFEKARIIVIGDLMLDHYMYGNVKRISPEAPVPVVNIISESINLGGAANVMNNIVSLDGTVEICGVIGDDRAGERLFAEIKTRGVDPGGAIIEKGRPTTEKTRIIAHSQQVVRFDREKKDQISLDSQKIIYNYVTERIDKTDCIIISDYAKGVVSQWLIKNIILLAINHGVKIVVDPKVNNFNHYKDVTVITPNNLEASLASGIEIEDENSLKKAGDILLEKLGCEAVLVTRGEMGMTLFERDHKTKVDIPTVAQNVYDVTGAGDTVVSVIALALSVGANMLEAATLANYAAGIVVGRVGTATTTRTELLNKLDSK